MPRITGADGVKSKLGGKLGQQAITNVGQALFAGGEEIRAEAAHLITAGAVSGRGHIPSRPGEPPSNDTGTLVAHLETTQLGPLQVEVSSNAPAAVPLQFGSSKMLPRPYMDVATRRKKDSVVDLVRQAINRATKA